MFVSPLLLHIKIPLERKSYHCAINRTPRIALSVGPFVRHKIWSYFQWEEQQQQQLFWADTAHLTWSSHVHNPVGYMHHIMDTCLMYTCIMHPGIIHTCIHQGSCIRVTWTHLHGSHGLSARRAQRTKSRRPEGPQTRSLGGPEGHLNF